jgi:hypothetical protein
MPKQVQGPVRSVWDVLYADDEKGLEHTSEQLDGRELAGLLRRSVPRQPAGVASLVQHQIADAARHALREEHVLDVVLRVWKTYDDVVQAARRTRENPGSSESVPITSDTMSSQHHVAVDVLIDETTVRTVDFRVDLAVKIDVALVAVSAGAIQAIRVGRATATATLAVEGTEVLTRSREIDLQRLLDQDTRQHPVEMEVRLPGLPAADSRSVP